MDFNAILHSIVSFLTSFGLKLVGAIIILVVGIFLIKWVIKLITRGNAFQKAPKNVQILVKNMIKVCLYVLLFFSVAMIIGVPAASLVAVLSSAGLAIGLALQGGLSNIAGGIIILCFKPFEVGDFIDDGTHAGTVTDIGLFYTKLTTPDNKVVTIPNGSISNQSVTDFSAKETRRLDIKFSVAYDSDIDMVKETLLAMADAHELVLKDPAPFVRLGEQGDSALVFYLRVWVNSGDYWTVNFDLLEASKKIFDKRGIEIPFPQLDVHTK
ncbi:MAG: mechanosensitive ion channel family protein [Eubacteriales bacterium]